MILDIDGGNTRLKWRLGAAGVVAESGAGELAALTHALSGYGARVQMIRVASVASDDYREHLSRTLEAVTGIRPLFAVSQPQWDHLRSAYANPVQMGVDRWLAMMAAWDRCRGSFAVVDAGSALTVDYVAEDGRHLGGYILPGWRMLFDGLSQGTAKVRPDASASEWASSPGVDTSTCVNQGVAWLWESWVARLEKDCANLALKTRFLTGGDAVRARSAGLDAIVWRDMVLDGLGLLSDDAFVGLSSR